MSINTDNLDIFSDKGDEIIKLTTSTNGKTLREIVSEEEGKVGRLFDSSKTYEKGSIVIDNQKTYKSNKDLATSIVNDFDEVVFSSTSNGISHKIIHVNVLDDTFVEYGDTTRNVLGITKVADGNYTIQMDTDFLDTDNFFSDVLEDNNQTFTVYPFIWKKAIDTLEVRLTKELTADTLIQNNFQIVIIY